MPFQDSPRDRPCGFIRSLDPRSARRQLHLSVGVAAVLGLAVVTSAFALRPVAGPAAASRQIRLIQATPRGQPALESRLRAAPPNNG